MIENKRGESILYARYRRIKLRIVNRQKKGGLYDICL